MANLPDKYIAVIEDTDEARDAYGHAHGSIELSLGARQIRALEDGKAVASFDGEYVTYITFEAPVAANACCAAAVELLIGKAELAEAEAKMCSEAGAVGDAIEQEALAKQYRDAIDVLQDAA